MIAEDITVTERHDPKEVGQEYSSPDHDRGEVGSGQVTR